MRQREQILKLILENENVSSPPTLMTNLLAGGSIHHVLMTICLSLQVDRSVDLFNVAMETDGFSGSDLREMCRDAALLCVRDYVHTQSDRYLSVTSERQAPVSLCLTDRCARMSLSDR